MLSARLLLLFMVTGVGLNAQQTTGDTSVSRLATVNVVVTDMKGKPSKGEQVFFRGHKSAGSWQGWSDAGGKFTLQLPPGDTYFITVKGLTDTARYGVIDIPSLGEDEYFTEPFRVAVKFELAKTYALNNVHFDVGKASLRPESFPELEELAGYLENRQTVRIEIAGHTDNTGKDADNLRLSQQRAETIRNYLIKKGIQPSRVTAKGYGASQPVADNGTEEGRQLNRRTEVRVI